MKEYITTKKGSVVQASPKRLLTLASVALFATILLASIVPIASADPGWWNDSWQYRKMVTIDHTKVPDVGDPSTTYANFPVLVNAAGLSNIKAGGADIRFTDSSGNQLPREIEYYSGGTLYAWVNVTLTNDAGDSTDDVLYMYYGNSNATEPAAGSTYGSEKVWDANYMMVQHLEETCSGSGGKQYDSTSNDNDGSTWGGVATGAAGKIDGADEFDDSYEYVNCGDSPSLNPAHITLEAWIKPVSVSADVDKQFFDKRDGGYNFRHANEKLTFNLDNTYLLSSSDVLTAGEWHHVAATYDGTYMRLYHNGISVASPKNIGSISFSNSIPLYLGAISWSAWHQKYSFEGTMDEARVSASARSVDWLRTSYNNQNSPSTFCSFGGEEEELCTGCQRWYLSSTGGSYVMYKGNDSKPAGTVTVGDGGEQIWRADENATYNLSFPADTWTGHITFNASSNDTTVRVWVGEWNGSQFTPSAAEENATIDGSGDFSISAGEFNVSKGEWLAFRIQDYDADGNSSVVSVGLSSSYLTSGATDPAYPIPELPAMVLFLVGVLVLAGYMRAAKKKEN